MQRLLITAGTAVLALAAARATTPEPQYRPLLKEERVFLKYTPAVDEAVVLMEAESEVGLQRIEVRDPFGGAAISLRAKDIGGQEISGFVIETTEATLAEVLAAYGEGRYEIRARTASGHFATGGASLVHDLLAEPRIDFPVEGMTGVPTVGLEVRWTPDPEALSYSVSLEQNDNDGVDITVPPGTSSLRIPDGVLEANTETILEIGVEGPNRNTTYNELTFYTL